MGQARESIVTEGRLFVSLVHAANDGTAAKLRQELLDNERSFHEVASEIAGDLPEDRSKIEMMVSRFDHLAATGWQAAATALQMPSDARDDLLAGDFAQTLDELRDQSEKMELGLHAHDASYRIELPGFGKAIVISI
jgi:hypothetical protein